MHKKHIVYGVCFVILLCLAFLFLLDGDLFSPPKEPSELTIIYPFNETLFPFDIASPEFYWKDENSDVRIWSIRFEFDDNGDPIHTFSKITKWTPDRQLWETIKNRSLEARAKITISGLKKARSKRILSNDSIWFSISNDEVGAPIFFRDVPLPFIYAVNHKCASKEYHHIHLSLLHKNHLNRFLKTCRFAETATPLLPMVLH